MKKLSRKNLDAFYDALTKCFGTPGCSLDYKTPYQLLVATVLSAQCTDRRVNVVTPAFFRRWKDAKALEKAELSDVEEVIRTCGFYHAKAKNLLACAKALCENFGGKVPDDMEKLTTLPGVGRKTANVLLSNAFNKPGFPVDTHVTRVLNLAGFVSTDDAAKIEFEICPKVEPERWGQFSHLLITLGRSVCKAGHPACGDCPVKDMCKKFSSTRKEKSL